MKHILILIAFLAASCGKEDIQSPLACGYVFDKYFQNPPGDTTLALRTYWLRLVSSPTIPVPPAPPNTFWVLQVPKAIYDTMLVAGQTYPPQYCY